MIFEIIGDVLGVFAGAGARTLRVRRAERRLAAGRPVRIPCSARSKRPGWPAQFVTGTLRITDGSVVFANRHEGALELTPGGTCSVPHLTNPEFPATKYRVPDGGAPVDFEAHHRYLPLLKRALTSDATQVTCSR